VFQRALAFEPEPRNFAYLKRNVDQNGLADRIKPFQAAMSATNGEIEFELCPENYGDHRVRLSGAPSAQYNHFHEHDRTTIKVPVHTLDEMVPSLDIALGDVALVWMDVQGHEGHIFQGAQSLVAAGVPFVFEFWPYGLQSTGLDVDWFVDFIGSRFTYLWDLKSATPDRMPAAHIRQLYETLCNGDAVAQTDVIVV
jgi:FkbM family methyltransferase